MITRLLVVVSLCTTIVMAVVGCDPLGRPSLTPAFGARTTDGQLRLWTGSPCHGVTQITLTFDPYGGDRAEFVLAAPNELGIDLEYFTLGESLPGLQVAKPLPSGFDWQSAQTMRISLEGNDVQWGTTAYLDEAVKGSTEHPADSYWFQDVGWLDPGQVTAQDGKTFLGLCTPSPAK